MAYKLTPEQYKDAARNRVTSQNTAENTNSAVSAYARALNMRRALDNKNRGNAVQNEELVKPDDDQNDENWFVRTLSTIVAPVVRFNEGMFKFVESAVLDLGAGLTASVLDLFGADETAKEVQSWAAQDLVGEAFEWEPIQAIYSNSYSNEWGKFGEILQEGIYTVGQQAIPILLNFVPGVGPILSKGAFAMGVYGASFEQASQEGGSVLGSSAYGLISAGIETGIETLFGTLGGSKVIKSGIDKAVSSLAKSEAGQQVFRFLIDNVAGEGLEEVASGLVENYIKAMTYKGDYSSVEAYFNNILSAPPATQEELWEQFILGAFAGGLMGGGARVITKTSPTLSTAETIQEIDELKEKGYNLSLRGKDTAATELQLTAKENELMERVNKNFDRFTERRKAGNTADGILSFMEQNFNTDENGHFISFKNALIHSENASYGIGQAELNDALGANGKLHEGSFEGEALISKQKVEKALKNINASLGKDRLKVVFADMSDVQDYGYIKNNVIVVNAAHLGTQLEFKVTENGEVNTYKADAGLSTLLHEVLHFTDDTKAGKQLRELLNKYATEQKTVALVENVALASDAIQNKQNFDFNGELSARQLEHLLFNENIINQLTEDNSSLSKRILNKATRLLNALKGEKLAETKELRALLGKTVKLYNKAIAQVGKGKRIYSKGVDKEEEIEYSKRTNQFKYQPRDVSQITAEEYNHHAWATLNGILSQNESGAFLRLIGRMKLGDRFTQTANGFYMLPVGENGIENKVVYTDGNWESPSIEKIVEINFDTKQEIEDARSLLEYYEQYANDFSEKAGGLFKVHDNSTYEYYQWKTRNQGSAESISQNARISRDSANRTGTSDEIRKSRRLTEGNNERSDEFRRIQEESLGMSNEELRAFRSGSKEPDADLRGRLTRVYRDEINTSGGRRGDGYDVAVNTEKFTVYKDIDAELFHDIFEVNRRYLWNGELVDLHSVGTNEDGIGYEECENYLSSDGLSGFSITPDGDVISVFNLSDKRGFLHAISEVVKKKGRTLDCYNSPNQPLAGMYTKYFGFKVASIMDYNMEYDHDNIAENHGKPKVYFMVNTESEVEERHFTENQYDEAVEYQKQFVKTESASGDIRRSRRILNEEEMRQAIDDVVEMLTVIGNVDENTFDVTVNKSSLLSSYMAKINELSAKGKLTENSKVVTRLVESIFNSAVMTEHYTDEVRESALTLDILRRHIHSIDLTTDSIKPEIQNKYGKSNNIFRLWSKKGGVAWDTAVQEIVEELPHLQKDSDIETLYNIFNTYTNCVADLKQVRKQVSELVKNANEAKRLMARSLVLSLSEKGTELVTKVTSEKLQSAITEERKALRDTLSAIKSGKTEVAFAGENISSAVKEQLQTVVELVANERAQRYAAKKAESVVFHIKKGITGEELRDIRKTTAYQALESYIAERRLSEGKEITIKSIEENAPAIIQSMQRSISAVRSIRDVHANNAEVLRGLLSLDTNSLKKHLTELYAEETYLSSVDELESGIKGLFKTSVDGKNILLSYDEMISSGALKNAVNSFLSYYTETNPILQDMVDSGLFEQMQEKIKAYAEYVDILSGQKYSEMSLAEKQTFNNQLTNFLSSVLRATKPIATVTVNGETVSAAKYRDKSLRAIDMMMQRDKNGNYRPESRALAAFSAKYLQDSVRPYEAIALAENHSGALEALFNEIREGAIKGENARADLEDIVFNFAQDKNNKNGNKKYSNVLMSEEVTIKHNEGEFVVTRGELVGLYLTLSQEDGFLHADALNPFAEGIYFDNKNMSTNYRNKTALKFTAENLVSLENQLTETDLRFIENVREFLKRAGALKGEIDMQLYGMKRLLGEDYYPLQTDESARTSKLGDKVSFYDALDPSGHLSINQSRTSGLKALRVRNVADQLTSYAKSVGLYYGVAVPIANMRLVYNSKGVNGESIKSFIAKHSTKEFDPYLDKLLLDVQGAIKVSDSFMERQRQRYAAFAIAANIKSPIKALGGLFSLTGKLKTTSFLKGLVKSPFSLIKSGKVDFSQMYEYCPATRIRYRDRQATLSAMNVEGVSKLKNSIVDKLAIGIELVDKYTVYVAWNAAKAEVGAVGVNANNSDYLKRAGKLLNEALDTIDRFEMTERNAFSRSEDSFRRGLAMFSSSSQAQLTQFVDKTFKLSQLFHLKKQLPTLIQEAQSAKSKIAQNVARLEEKIERARASGDNDALRRTGIELKQEKSKLTDKTLYISELHQKQANLPKEIKSGKLFTQKAIISISTAIAVSALLSQLMSNLMADKDEEEWGEEFAYGVLDESLVNVFGMFPFIGQFYNALEFDFGNFEKKSYDMSFWLIDEWNAIADALNSFVALVDGTGTKTPTRVARDFLYAIGQWFGIPTRNLYNAMNAVLKALPSADYTVDNAFSKGNYGSDLKKAIDAKDTELAETIVKLMMKDTFGTTDTVTVKTIRSLYEQGYTGVLPKTVSSSIKINGETYSMTAKQQKAFKAIYSQADAKVEQLIGKQSFKNLSAKVQADSIKWIYDYYYEKAKEELSGIEDDSKKAIFAKYIPIETLAVAYCTARSLESDKDRQGNAITGTKKAKVVKYLNTIRASAAEKYMILGYLGYAPVSNQAKALITAFARKNGATTAEIEELLDECNIAA